MDIVVRVLLTYLFVMVGLRLVGKRTFGELTPADLVILLLIPELFQQAMIRDDYSMTAAIIGVSALLLLAVVTDTLGYRFPRFQRMMSGKAETVVSHGLLRPDRLDRERLSPDEILDAMHRAGLERMEQVKWAVLYPDGNIAIVPWEPGSTGVQPVEPKRPV